MLCICVFVYLHFCICLFDIWEYHLWYPWIILFSKICHMLGVSGTWSYAVFLYVCICIFVFACLTHGNMIFVILAQTSLQKYTTCWVFLALRHMLYLCICVFVFVYFCMRHLVISVLISLDQELSENIWFVWPKTSYSGDVTVRDGRTNKQTTSEDRATQLLICEALSLAISSVAYSTDYIMSA